jgi:cell division GTPase FtsZ
MKDKIGFVCIGQAGGNIGTLLEREGFDCVFINSSTEDLKYLDTKFRYHIPGGEGCNHDRDKAIKLVKENYRGILQEIFDKLPKKEILFFVFSTGGGTGSGAAPILIDMVTTTHKDIYAGAVAILPSLEETAKPHMNEIKCYKQLTTIERLGAVFNIDNDKGDKFILNKTFVELFKSMLTMPDNVSEKGNIDKAEIMEMLKTRGAAVITTCTCSNPASTETAIIKSWEDNIFADIEDDKSIVYMGLSLTNEIPTDGLTKILGKPLDIFRGFNPERNITLLTGLSFPETRIMASAAYVENDREHIKKSLTRARTGKIDIADFDDLTATPKERDKDKACTHDDIDDVLNRWL